MLPGYHKLNNRHALNQLLKGIYKPDPKLGIGDAEYLAPMNLKVYYPNTPKAVYMPVPASIEQATPNIYGSVIDESDFPTLHWVGDAIGGF